MNQLKQNDSFILLWAEGFFYLSEIQQIYVESFLKISDIMAN